jgi:hypothetical protein
VLEMIPVLLPVAAHLVDQAGADEVFAARLAAEVALVDLALDGPKEEQQDAGPQKA